MFVRFDLEALSSPPLLHDPEVHSLPLHPKKKILCRYSISFFLSAKSTLNIIWLVDFGVKRFQQTSDTFCPFRPGLPSSPARPFLPCRSHRNNIRQEKRVRSQCISSPVLKGKALCDYWIICMKSLMHATCWACRKGSKAGTPRSRMLTIIEHVMLSQDVQV